MIILGDISGIQSFVFDVPEAGGGQTRRLRARSFLVQALAECAALRVLDSMGWPLDASSFLLCSAGKFILRGSGDSACITPLMYQCNEELLRETAGELRLALAVGAGGSDVADYRQAQIELQRVKAAPWRLATGWVPSKLVLPPLETPCSLCRRAPGSEIDHDPDTSEPRRVCRHCLRSYELGRVLPHAELLVLNERREGQFTWFGLAGKMLHGERNLIGKDGLSAVIGLNGRTTPPAGCPPGRYIARRLMSGIPLDANADPVWFVDLAKRAKGDHLLAVLKADVDSLGVQIEQRLASRSDLTDFLCFADSLDAFFTEKLQHEISGDPQWQSIYTVFSGGDDLVMIGPWDVIFRFAGRLRDLFRRQFSDLTLSAGIALFKPKRPVKTAIVEADRLLDLAKAGAKDQCAAFEQVWNWEEHAMILRQAEQIANWVESSPNQMQRGWLHKLLDLAALRHGNTPEPLATARLAYHVGRNYRSHTDACRWAKDLIARFDDHDQPGIRYLPAIVRHALTSTRHVDALE